MADEKKTKKIQTLEDLLSMVKYTFLEDVLRSMMTGEYCSMRDRPLSPTAEYVGDMTVLEMGLITAIEKQKDRMRILVGEIGDREPSTEEMRRLMEMRFESDVLERIIWVVDSKRFACLARTVGLFGFCYAGANEVYIDADVGGRAQPDESDGPAVPPGRMDLRVVGILETLKDLSSEEIKFTDEEKERLIQTLAEIFAQRKKK